MAVTITTSLFTLKVFIYSFKSNWAHIADGGKHHFEYKVSEHYITIILVYGNIL